MSAHNEGFELYNNNKEILDPGDAGVILFTGYGQTCPIVTAGAETRTVPNPTTNGLKATIYMLTYGGDCTITFASAYNEAGATVVVFSAAGQFLPLESVRTSATAFAWRVVRPDGVQGDVPLQLLLSGAADSAGLLLGGGTTAAPNTTATADKNFIDFRTQSSATTGDNRGSYLRHMLTGDGTGGGETLRAYTNVNANLGTAHGAHISLSYEATAGGSETSGLGVAVRGTLEIPDVASWAPAGTVYAGMFELYSNGTASDPAGLTELAVLCLSNSGDATGKADVDTDAAIFALNGWTAAANVTKVRSSVSLAELPSSTIGMRVLVDGVAYYLPLVLATEWN